MKNCPQLQKIKKSSQFKLVKESSFKFICKSLIINRAKHKNFSHKMQSSSSNLPASIGIIASKMVGKANERNLAKRKIRAAINLLISQNIFHQFFLQNEQYLIIAKKTVTEQHFSQLICDLKYSLSKINSFK